MRAGYFTYIVHCVVHENVQKIIWHISHTLFVCVKFTLQYLLLFGWDSQRHAWSENNSQYNNNTNDFTFHFFYIRQGGSCITCIMWDREDEWVKETCRKRTSIIPQSFWGQWKQLLKYISTLIKVFTGYDPLKEVDIWFMNKQLPEMLPKTVILFRWLLFYMQ